MRERKGERNDEGVGEGEREERGTYRLIERERRGVGELEREGERYRVRGS